MKKNSCCDKQKLRKGLWSPEEDEKLVNHVTLYGIGCWSSVPKLAGLQRCGKSCRLRWINYLRPDLKRGTFSPEEESMIINLHRAVGNRWAQIASHLPGRTDNEIKNFWNSYLKKKLVKEGIDPITHEQITKNYETAAHHSQLSSVDCSFSILPGLDNNGGGDSRFSDEYGSNSASMYTCPMETMAENYSLPGWDFYSKMGCQYLVPQEPGIKFEHKISGIGSSFDYFSCQMRSFSEDFTDTLLHY